MPGLNLARDKRLKGWSARDKGFAVIGARMMTGFGGMFAVTAVLLLVQLVTGVKAFPL